VENSTKKKWQKPEVMILSQDNVNGGAQTGYNENSIASSHPTNVGGYQYFFNFVGGGSGFGHHPKTFYVS
jgi:hypothetical protein